MQISTWSTNWTYTCCARSSSLEDTPFLIGKHTTEIKSYSVLIYSKETEKLVSSSLYVAPSIRTSLNKYILKSLKYEIWVNSDLVGTTKGTETFMNVIMGWN